MALVIGKYLVVTQDKSTYFEIPLHIEKFIVMIYVQFLNYNKIILIVMNRY